MSHDDNDTTSEVARVTCRRSSKSILNSREETSIRDQQLQFGEVALSILNKSKARLLARSQGDRGRAKRSR